MTDVHVGRYIDQLLRGVVEPLTLHIISELPSHGYQIAKEIEKRSAGYLCLTASTIYTVLRRLEEDGLVSSTWHTVSAAPRRRYYQLTDDGRRILREKLLEWERFADAAEQVLARV
jgi:PadR family transcriptional regulator, regulatory protein PadR